MPYSLRMKRISCINCSSEKLRDFLDLGYQPNGNNFSTSKERGKEKYFPLVMLVCENCWQVQIDEFPPQEMLFLEHPYLTGLNETVLHHFEQLADDVINSVSLPSGSLVLDIGCNDGSLLQAFKRRGMEVAGVDPGVIPGEIAKQAGFTVFRTFWNLSTGVDLHKKSFFPDLITATAVFYHVPDLHDFIAGLKQVMKANAVFVVQCVSLMELIKQNQFDHFYHEHSCIHSVTALNRLFESTGLKIIKVQDYDIHGGSFVLYITLTTYPDCFDNGLQKALKREKDAGLCSLDTFYQFSRRVNQNGQGLVSKLKYLKDSGNRIYALGAPAKGSTLINFCDINIDLIDCAVEVNQNKIGCFIPGTNIPIISESKVLCEPDYYLVLTWNFLDFFIEKYNNYLETGGYFIVPVPSVQIIGKECGSAARII